VFDVLLPLCRGALQAAVKPARHNKIEIIENLMRDLGALPCLFVASKCPVFHM
jgi:hypothetical protein